MIENDDEECGAENTRTHFEGVEENEDEVESADGRGRITRM